MYKYINYPKKIPYLLQINVSNKYTQKRKKMQK
jgi:hypothetical protein